MPIDACLLRCLLFVPGDRPDRFLKAEAAGADAVVFDLEDAVAPARKDMARTAVLAHLRDVPPTGRARIVRINAVATLNGLRDVLALAGSGHAPNLVMLPKVEAAAEIRLAAQWLPSGTGFIAIVESACGLENAARIAAASPALGALAFGGADLAADLGAALAWDSLSHARGRLVTAAATQGLGALDVPWLDIGDSEGLARECATARRMGFTGKIAIHPAQVAAILAGFSPGAEEIARAQRIVAADAAAQGGVATLDGRMIDAPVVRAARRSLALAERQPIPPA